MSLFSPGGNANKQRPKPINGTGQFSHAICPTNESHTKRPTYVVINNTGSYAFCYDSGSHATVGAYITGSVINANDTAVVGISPIRLDISPVSWRKTDSNSSDVVGDVTFVYVRVR